MTQHRNLDYGDRLPEALLDAFQEFISTLLVNFQLTLASATSLEVVASTVNGQVGAGIQGRWRYNEATVNAAHPAGAAGQYDVFVTASDNVFVPGTPETDNTVYTFGLVILASPSVPGTALYRKVAETTWDGSAIVAVTMKAGTFASGLVKNTGSTLPTGPTDGQRFLLRVGSTPFEFLPLVYDATYAKWVSPVFAETKINEYVFPVSASYDLVPGSAIVIPNFKNYYDAGLRLQLQLAGAFQDQGVPPTSVWLSPVIHEADENEAWASLVAAADGNALVGGSADADENVEFKDWFQPTVTPTKDHLLLRGATRMTGVSTDMNVNNAVIRARVVSA